MSRHSMPGWRPQRRGEVSGRFAGLRQPLEDGSAENVVRDEVHEGLAGDVALDRLGGLHDVNQVEPFTSRHR